MKAIQIKYMPPTNTRGAYFKAMAESCNSLCQAYNHSMNAQDQAKQLAQLYADAFEWGDIYGFGQLPNGDYVATLGE